MQYCSPPFVEDQVDRYERKEYLKKQMKTTTPTRAGGFGGSGAALPSSISPATGAQMSRLSGFSPSLGTPIQNVPLPGRSANTASPRVGMRQPASVAMDDQESVAAAAAASSSRTDVILPFRLDACDQLLTSAASSASSGRNISGINLSREQLIQLQIQAGEYVDNLDLTLKTLFANDNSRLRQTIVNTSETPLTFMFMRLQQQMLKLSGDYSAQRERATLAKLAQLLDA